MDDSEILNPSVPDVVTKYKTAGDIVNKTMNLLISKVKEGASVYQLCLDGDNEIATQVASVYKGKIPKGIAFPTCISVNHIACHYSPMKENGLILKKDDLVKIELGVHIDGFPVLAAHTVSVGSSKNSKITGEKANLLMATHIISEVALRLLRSGKSNEDITEMVGKILKVYNVKAVEGSLSFQVERNSLSGTKQFMLNPTDIQKKSLPKCNFEDHDVFVLDVTLSSGEGKIKPGDEKPTVFRKTENNYALKLKASRNTLSEISTKHGSMAFNIRSLEDETKSKLGLVECISHQLVQAYEPLYEKETDQIARIMFTTILMPAGPLRLTESFFDSEVVQSNCVIEDIQIKELLASEVRKTKANRNKKAESKPTTNS